MTVREIIITYLRKIGADGLCGHQCGCSIEDMEFCENCCIDCVPAKKIVVNARHMEYESGECEIGDEMFVEMKMEETT